MGKIIDITGHKYHRLTVVKSRGVVPQGKEGDKTRAIWLCKCDCGKELVANSNALRRGNTKSCGCLKRETVRRAKTHGLSRTPEYVTWCNMIARCTYQWRKDYKHYGGRGIKVCDRWRRSFEAFLSDMGPRPFPRATLERDRVNEDYEPGNCRWVSQKEQTRNKRTNVRVTINGVTKTIAEWAEIHGLNQRLVRERLLRGWPPERAVSPPRKTRWSTRRGEILVPAKSTV